MEFGLIKSKIEKRLSNSYLNEDIKKDLFIFNELVIKIKMLVNYIHYIVI